MRKFSLAFVVFATTLTVVPPSALCDSFGYRTLGSRIESNSGFDTGRRGIPGGIAGSGVFSNTEIPEAGGLSNNGTLGMNPVERPVDGAYFFDSLLNAGGRTGNGALVDLSGQQMVLLTGNTTSGIGSDGRSGQFYFADKGTFHVSNELQKGNGAIRSNSASLAVTPEPGSLFLLGTGLLGLALVLFWKAAKRSTGA